MSNRYKLYQVYLDLVNALREVDWSPPRPPSPFLRLSPHGIAHSRLKCNLYYYRTNYFIMIVSILVLGFLTRPLAILVAVLALSVPFLNDSFAGSYNDKARRHEPLEDSLHKMTPVIRGRPSIHVCGQPRWVFVLIFSLGLWLYTFPFDDEWDFFCFTVTFALWYISCGLFTVSLALLNGLLATLLHASFDNTELEGTS